MYTYPVQLEVISPLRFERFQLLLRLALAIALGVIGVTTGWLAGALYFALPVFIAIYLSVKSTDEYLASAAPRLWRALSWLLAFWAYMLLLVDHFPVEARHDVKIELRPSAHPTAHAALWRLVTSIPNAFVLCIVAFISCVLLVVAVLYVLFGHPIPSSIQAFQSGYLRWCARLVAYHASLVDEYPPFSFGERDTGATTTMAG